MHRAGEVAAAFDAACEGLAAVVTGGGRRAILDEAARWQPFGRALEHLGRRMRAHDWAGAGPAAGELRAVVPALDAATRADGLHVLHDWDGKAGRVTERSFAEDVLAFVAARRAGEPTQRVALAILVDYYLLYVLALVAMRAWDHGEPGANLDRVTRLLEALQGPEGSGHRFADNAETLLLIATSHYEPDERGYDRLLSRARVLPARNRLAMALTHAQAMGSHLRFGFEVTYGKFLTAMRDDNGADYPWLGFGLAWLMEEYARMAAAGDAGDACDRVVEGLINGLTPDPAAFVVKPPASLDAHRAEYDRFRELFAAHRAELVAAFDACRPRDQAYSPIALFFNFSQNVLKGMVVDALLHGTPSPYGLNDLFTGIPREARASGEKMRIARTLTAYARANPDTIRGRLSPVIVYAPDVGRQYFGAALRVLRQT